MLCSFISNYVCVDVLLQELKVRTLSRAYMSFISEIAHCAFAVYCAQFCWSFSSIELCNCRSLSQSMATQTICGVFLSTGFTLFFLKFVTSYSTTPKISTFVDEYQLWRQPKCNLCAFFPYLSNVRRKFELLIFQGSVATCLR